uniref:C2H2-type domain-containing protein n=1 Tax=Pectinophora gossypiella TaxID=13191 RepID=A0A1E1WRA3_PECGO
MLVFPQWRRELPEEACRTPRWMPAERFAPYLARPIALPPLPPQIDDEDSSGGSSPERNTSEGEGESCGWRGCGARYPSIARLSAHVARVHALAHSDGLFYCGWKGCGRPQRGFNARLVHIYCIYLVGFVYVYTYITAILIALDSYSFLLSFCLLKIMDSKFL